MADDFLKKYQDAFINESITHIDSMNAGLLQLEKDPANQKFFHEVFRSTHTLKSMAATMGYDNLVALCHLIEDALDAVRNDKIQLNQAVDPLFEGFDLLSASLKEISLNKKELDLKPEGTRLHKLLVADKNSREVPGPKKKPVIPISDKMKTIEVNVDRLDTLMKLVEELLVSRIKLELLRESINNTELTAAIDALGRNITDLQYNIMQVRLVPIGYMFNRFPRMVRDLAKAQGKEVELQIEGSEIELDRSLIDEIGESMAHLIKNAIDHGLEDKEERLKAKKSVKASIRLAASRSKEFVLIEISDDGGGLDLENIRKIALEKNLISPVAKDEEVLNCIFKGISTTRKVTPVSGRGLGLSIVKQKIESIGGSIQVHSNFGKGTRFFIKIPLTLAVIKVLFVTVSQQIYAIPINTIERLLTVPAEEIKGLMNYNAIVYEEGDIPLTHLASLFGMETRKMTSYPIVVIRQGNERIGLVVDFLLSTQEVVIKPLVKVIKENRFFSGSALIGSGEMVLIIDVDHIFISRRQQNEWRTSNAV